MTMLRYLNLLGLAAVLGFALSVNARAAEELIVGSWGGVWDDTVRDNIVKPLVEETGAEVSILSGNSSEQFARLLASPDAPPVDVLFLDLDIAVSGFAQDMFEILDAETIPNLANVYPASIYGGGQAVAQSFGAVTIVYDSNKISIDSWQAFFDEANTGNYALSPVDSWGFYVLSALAQTTSGDENNLEAGWKALNQLAPGAAMTIGDYALRQVFEREEIAFAPMYGCEAYVMYTSGLDSIRAAKPKEGMIAVPNMLVIPKNSRNPELARRFVHHALSPESQLAFTLAYAAGPSVKDVDVPDDVIPWMPYGDEEFAALIRPDWATMNEQRDAMMERWNREFVPLVGTR
jgi:putative spermidine/putrescine transport system substrate-binding protein